MTGSIRGDNRETPGGSRLAAARERVAEFERWLGAEGRGASTGELTARWQGRVAPFWGLFPGIYEGLAALLLKRGENFLAAEVAAEAMAVFPGRGLPAYQRALALARTGGRERARVILEKNWEPISGLSDARPLVGRLFKDAWKARGERADLERSRDEYAAAAGEERDDVYYPAVNAATLSALLDDDEAAGRMAALVREDLERRGGASNYWERVSLAEARLASGDLDGARAMYAEAVREGVDRDQILTSREQAVLLLEKLGMPAKALDDVLGRPVVLVVTGHRVDAAGRERPRFPAGREASVRARMASVIERVGPWIGVAGAASGGDLIGLEVLRERGVDAAVVLPLERESYAAVSVGEAWRTRFEEACAGAVTVWVTPQGGDPEDGTLWGFGNEMILGTAARRAREWGGDLVVLAVWDGALGDGAGGTADLVARSTSLGVPVWVVDPLTDEPARLADGFEWVGVEGSARFCVHASGVEPVAGLDAALKGAREVIELEGELRATFDECAGAVRCAGELRRLMVKVGIGLTAGVRSGEGRAHLFRQAAQLARAARGIGTTLAGWEFVALAGRDCGAAFEAAGRREGAGGEVFAVSFDSEMLFTTDGRG